jgi:replication factor A1
VKFHYLLVDDLIGRDEFERRVEEMITASGDLLDEQTAAMVVVRDLGRTHIKVRDLFAASSLACLFCKVISVGQPREFERPDGSAGRVVNVMVGDETGRARLTLWDEKAEGVHEIEIGDVLEVLGRPKEGGRLPEITGLAVQKAACEIACPEEADSPARPNRDVDLEVRLIAVEPPRTFTRRDGSTGELVEAVIGNEDGTFRLVCWSPPLLEAVQAGSNIILRGVSARSSDRGTEYSIGETGSIAPAGREITLPISRIADLQEGGSYALAGTVVSTQSPRSFVTRNGRPSSVRNLVLADETGEVPVVVWGEKALEHLIPGDRIEIYNASARRGRYGDLELSLSWGSALVVQTEDQEEITVEGTIIATRQGTCIDTGSTCYLLAQSLPIGYDVRAHGTLHRGVISLNRWETVIPDPTALRERLDRFCTGD